MLRQKSQLHISNHSMFESLLDEVHNNLMSLSCFPFLPRPPPHTRPDLTLPPADPSVSLGPPAPSWWRTTPSPAWPTLADHSSEATVPPTCRTLSCTGSPATTSCGRTWPPSSTTPSRQMDGWMDGQNILLIFRRNLRLRQLDKGTSIIKGLQCAKLQFFKHYLCHSFANQLTQTVPFC